MRDEGGKQKAEGGRQKAEGGGMKDEGGKQKAEGGRQKAEGGGMKDEVGTSLAVRQFVELIRGEREASAPAGCGMVCLQAEERYCLGCHGVRIHDVGRGAGGEWRVAWCRCCRKVTGG